ncbi:MAG: 50S ribosomal protein L3 [Thermoguttaceae bacterium]|nr:50S ribosomal protein L3 [Thermoguttaceae bacterium]
MTQVYTQSGRAVPVTVLQLGPCPVLQLKTKDKDSYEAVQIGFGDKSRNSASKSVRGHVANIESKRAKKAQEVGAELSRKANCEPQAFVREFRVSPEGFEVGQVLDVDVFNGVASVDVTALSKGRGYAGTMKRHNFGGQRMTHGVKKCHRHAGSTGCSAYPSRVQKGLRSSGQYGAVRCTTRNIKIVKADKANNLLLIYGAVPGPNGGYVQVRPSNYLPAPKPFPEVLVDYTAEESKE